LVAALAVAVSLSWLEVRVNIVLNHNGNVFSAVQIHYQQDVSISGIIVHRQACASGDCSSIQCQFGVKKAHCHRKRDADTHMQPTLAVDLGIARIRETKTVMA
jgi:hypothetical protein